MKMARASEDDREMAIKLCSALEAIGRDFWPEGAHCQSEDPESFDLWNDAHCGRALRHLMDILSGGSIGRVVWGMEVLLDPRNEVTDPNEPCLELHPRLMAALQDAKRLDWLADPANTIGNVELPTEAVTANLHSLRDAIDAAMAMPAND